MLFTTNVRASEFSKSSVTSTFLEKGTCAVTVTVTNGNYSYSYTNYYYAVNEAHCAQIANDIAQEIRESD